MTSLMRRPIVEADLRKMEIAESFSLVFGFSAVKGRVLGILSQYDQLTEYKIRGEYKRLFQSSADGAINRALHELVEEGFLLKEPGSGRKRTFIYSLVPPWHPKNPYGIRRESEEQLANTIADQIEKKLQTTVSIKRIPERIGPFPTREKVDFATMNIIAPSYDHRAFCGNGHWGKLYRRNIARGDFIYQRMGKKMEKKIQVILRKRNSETYESANLLRLAGADVRFATGELIEQLSIVSPTLSLSKFRANVVISKEIERSFMIIPLYPPGGSRDLWLLKYPNLIEITWITKCLDKHFKQLPTS